MLLVLDKRLVIKQFPNFRLHVTGAPYREVNSKVATAHASAPLFPPPNISQHHVVLRTISSPILFVLIAGPRVPTLTSKHGLPSGRPLENRYTSPSLSPPDHWKSQPSSLDFPPDCCRPRAPRCKFSPHYSGEHLHPLYRRTDAPPSTLHLSSIKHSHSNCSRESLD